MKSRTQKSARNMAVGLVSQVFTLLLSFVTRTFFIKLLTAEYLGINGLFSNVLTLLSFAELGIGSAMTYAMYKPVKENDHKLINQLMLFYKKAYTAIAITVGIIGLILSFFLGYIVAEPPKIPESLQVIFWLYIINNMASYYFRCAANYISSSAVTTNYPSMVDQTIPYLFVNSNQLHNCEQCCDFYYR